MRTRVGWPSGRTERPRPAPSPGAQASPAERNGVRPPRGSPDGMAASPTVTYTPSLDDFYRTHFRAVAGICYALTGSWWTAEEIAQEAFLAAHRKWPRVSQYDRPDLWIRRVAANLAVSRVRRRVAEAKALRRFASRRSPTPDDLPGEDDSLWRAVRALPARQAQAVTLRYVDDRSLVEIAEVLGCAEGTVKSHLARGRASLAARLGLTVSEATDEP
jgi:RNA polymerase sigma-70 factor (sigma-E family)